MEGRKVRKYRSGFTRLILTNKMYNQGGGVKGQQPAEASSSSSSCHVKQHAGG